jgi:hypothetical protein
MEELLNVIITASFIPSHPSIDLIKETIESLSLLKLPSGTKIILAHDAGTDEKYLKYLDNLREYIAPFPHISITIRETHGCLTGNIRNALQLVTSKYILVIQHDLPFVKCDIDIGKVIEDMEENPSLKHVRFNKRQNIKAAWDARNDLFGEQQKQSNYTYTRTPNWSDNNHLSRLTYYTDIIMKECADGGFMEHRLYRKISNVDIHKKYGTYIFGELNHPAVIKHTNGRKTRL